MSKDGLETLEQYEGSIDGLYDDPLGYATYGVGHLVHPAGRWKSLLLDCASSDKLCDSWIKQEGVGTKNGTAYLDRGVTGCAAYEKLRAKAGEKALETVAQGKFQKSYDDLPGAERVAVKLVADQAVNRESQLLKLTVSEVLQQDIKPFEEAVNGGVTGVALNQNEFDALVSFAFNVGTAAFRDSTLLKKINENRYRSGAADDREKAIAEIGVDFLAWNKSGGKVLDGLTQRRQNEANQFLKDARAELIILKAGKGGDGAAVGPVPLQPEGSMPAIAEQGGTRPQRPA